MEKVAGNPNAAFPDDEPHEAQGGASLLSQSEVSHELRNVAIISNPPEMPRSTTRGVFWDLLFSQLERRGDLGPETVEFHWTNPENEAVLPPLLFEKIKTGEIHGLIGIALSNQQVDRVRAQLPPDVPMVGFAQRPPYIAWFSVPYMIELAVPYLAKRGCRHIGYWRTLFTADQNVKNPFDLALRQEFIRQLEMVGLPFIPSLYSVQHILENRAGLSAHQMGYRVALEYFGGEEEVRPDGIVIAEDTLTVGALAALRHLGIRPGYDVHIVSQSNAGSPLLFGAEKEIVLLEFDSVELVNELFRMLHCLWAGEAVDEIVSIAPRLRDETA